MPWPWSKKEDEEEKPDYDNQYDEIDNIFWHHINKPEDRFFPNSDPNQYPDSMEDAQDT